MFSKEKYNRLFKLVVEWRKATHWNKIWPLSHWRVSLQLEVGGVRLQLAASSLLIALATRLTASCT